VGWRSRVGFASLLENWRSLEPLLALLDYPSHGVPVKRFYSTISTATRAARLGENDAWKYLRQRM